MKLLSTALFALLFSTSASFAAAPVVVITMKSLSYDPKIVQIKVGQSVQWKNIAYTDHSATSDNAAPAFDTGMIKPGKSSKEVTLTKPGQYAYHCSMHGKTMSGVINVQENVQHADTP